MKILQITCSLASGGAERFVVDLCNRLSENAGDEVVLMSMLDDSQPQWVHYLSDLSPRVRFVNLHCFKGMAPSTLYRVYQTVKHEHPDIVHIHCNLLLTFLPLWLYSSTHYVHTLHSMAWNCLKYKGLKSFYKHLYRHRVAPITISKECDKSFRSLYRLNTSTCIVNGREPMVRNALFQPDVTLPQGMPVFVHVARNQPEKNHPRLFRAFERLYKEGVKYHLLCLGSHYDEYFVRYASHPQIHIVGERKNVGDYLSLADFFVLSSDYEGLPLTLLEAMSIGVTPICTPAGGIVDVLHDGQNGYLSPDFTDEAFYQKIRQALTEQGRISPATIMADYTANYSMQVCAQHYYQVYQQQLS